MTRKTILAGLVAGSLVATSQAMASGIPVVDIASNIQNAFHYVKDVAHMASEIVQLKAQLQQAEDTFRSMNGVRGMASLLNNPMAREYLPKEASDIYDLAKGAGHGPLVGVIRDIRDTNAMLNAGDMRNSNAEMNDILSLYQYKLATSQATADAAFDQAGARFQKLQQLLDKVNAAPDDKDIQDLQARIDAEQVMMQNEMTKLDMLARLQSVQERTVQQQRREKAAKMGRGSPVYVGS